MFDEMIEIFGDEKLGAGEFASILRGALSSMTLAFIPPTLDQVLVGTIERSRHPDIKAAFLVGTTQKQFPMPVTFESILTEEDRAAAEDNELVLRDRLQQKLIARQYLTYIAFTRPAERLYVSYPLKDSSGSEVLGSPFVNTLKQLFTDVVERNAGDLIASRGHEVTSARRLADGLCKEFGKDNADCGLPVGLIAAMRSDGNEEIAEAGRIVEATMGYDNRAMMDAGAVDMGDEIDCSTSRLATFANCPYKHFAQYILRLRKRKEFGFERVDLGDFYHRVLDMLFRALKKAGKDLATASGDELRAMLDEQIEELIKNDAAILNFRRHSAHNSFIIDSACEVLYDCVAAMSEMSGAGAFRQSASELRFGKGKSVQCSFTTSGGKVVNLRGIIDRVDTAEVEGENVAIVFDYKRGEKSFSWDKLYHGLDTQLAVYMLAVSGAEVEGKKIDRVAGAFYLPVEAKLGSATLSGFEKEGEKFRYKAKGIFEGGLYESLDGEIDNGWDKFYNFRVSKGEPFTNFGISAALREGQLERVLELTKAKITGLSEKIFEGKIDITPYRIKKNSPCAFCDYAAVCRFDWQINDYNILASIGKEAVLSMGEDC
jgi:ATP-dependent helicase/nuclease subunit B